MNMNQNPNENSDAVTGAPVPASTTPEPKLSTYQRNMKTAKDKKQAKKDARKAKRDAMTPGQKRIKNYGIAVVVGICVGAIVTPSPSQSDIEEAAVAAAPAPITKTVTKEVEVTVPEVPTTCADAYADAEKTIALYETLGPISSDAIDAVSRFDSLALDEQTAKVVKLTEDVEAQLMDYYVNKMSCESEIGYTLPSGI